MVVDSTESSMISWPGDLTRMVSKANAQDLVAHVNVQVSLISQVPPRSVPHGTGGCGVGDGGTGGVGAGGVGAGGVGGGGTGGVGTGGVGAGVGAGGDGGTQDPMSVTDPVCGLNPESVLAWYEQHPVAFQVDAMHPSLYRFW